MDEITFRCGNCGRELSVPHEFEGHAMECPHCGAGIVAGSGALGPGLTSPRDRTGRADKIRALLVLRAEPYYPAIALTLLKVFAFVLVAAVPVALLTAALMLTGGSKGSAEFGLVALLFAFEALFGAAFVFAFVSITHNMYGISRRLEDIAKKSENREA